MYEFVEFEGRLKENWSRPARLLIPPVIVSESKGWAVRVALRADVMMYGLYPPLVLSGLRRKKIKHGEPRGRPWNAGFEY